MKNLDINEGTYNYCSQCKSKSCCCDFDEGIDNIVTTVEEKEIIVARQGNSAEKYFKKINEQAYNIISVDSICPFYDGGCTIYDIRPSDCKLFPYDLKEMAGRYYLIKYDLPCGSKNVDESVDNVIKSLLPIINTYTDKKIEEKVNKLPYIIIKEIQI